MAPPKAVCSAISQFIEIKEQIRQTVADIKKVIGKAIKIKSKILYGLVSLADAAASQAISAASTIASTLAQQVLSQASSLASTAIESALAPLLKILLSGPEAVFSLVSLPLEYAIKANEREAYFLDKAKYNIDLVISIFSKWTVEMSGAQFAAQMNAALPFIKTAIEKCETVIAKLEVDEDAGLTSQFDEATYGQMRNALSNAIEVTTPSSSIVDRERLEDNANRVAERNSSVEIKKIKARYKLERNRLIADYQAVVEKNSGKDDIGSQADVVKAKASLGLNMTRLDSKKKIEIDAAKLKAKNAAISNPDTYTGVVRNVSEEFADDMAALWGAMNSFITNTAKAYVQYRDSQVMTISTYDIRNLINFLIEKMIDLVAKAGNGAGAAVSGPLLLARRTLEGVRDMYTEQLRKFNSSNESVSSVSLSTKLVAGHTLMLGVDSTLSATITDSLVALINSDELLDNQADEMNDLFKKIYDIPDWDGELGVWGVSLVNSAAAPYPRLIAAATSVVSTLATTGLVPSEDSIIANRNRLIRLEKTFRSVSKHNSRVRSALQSYTPPYSPYIDEFKKAMAAVPSWIIKAFLNGPTAFNTIQMVANIAGDKANTDVLGEGNIIDRCTLAYPDNFPNDKGAATAMMSAEQLPVQYNASAASYLEETELTREKVKGVVRNQEIVINDESLYSTEPLS